MEQRTAATVEMRIAAALTRGRELAGDVERVTRGVYAVPSVSTPGELHIVTDLHALGLGTGLACDCRAGERAKPCRHVGAVVARRQIEVERQMTQRAMRLPVARLPRRQVALV
jgi:hypothetical protein